MAHLILPERKGCKTTSRMASDRQINSLPGLLAVKMIRQQISLINRLTHQSTTITNERRQWRTRAEHRRLKSGPPLIRGLNIHKNIPVSVVTKLTLGLREGFISSHLTADKLFLVNTRAIKGPPKIGLLLEAMSMPALSSNKGLSLLRTRMTFLEHNVQPAGTDVRSKPQRDCQQAKCDARADSVLHHRQYSNWIDVSGKLSNSHISLEPPEPSKWLPTERSDPSYISLPPQQPVLGQEHQSSGGQVFHHVHELGRQPTTGDSCEVKGWNSMTVRGRRTNHSWWWFKSPTNRKEARTSSASTAAVDASKQ